MVNLFGLLLPPTNLALLIDRSFVTLLIVLEDVLEEVVETLTGTKTALFQFGDVFPARFLWYISLINEEMLLKVYVLYVEL